MFSQVSFASLVILQYSLVPLNRWKPKLYAPITMVVFEIRNQLNIFNVAQ